jgi:hypothetical protein
MMRRFSSSRAKVVKKFTNQPGIGQVVLHHEDLQGELVRKGTVQQLRGPFLLGGTDLFPYLFQLDEKTKDRSFTDLALHGNPAPIISTSRWTMDRPNPVPPYSLVVEESTCLKVRNSSPRCSPGMPIPEVTVDWGENFVQMPSASKTRAGSGKAWTKALSRSSLLRS